MHQQCLNLLNLRPANLQAVLPNRAIQALEVGVLRNFLNELCDGVRRVKGRLRERVALILAVGLDESLNVLLELPLGFLRLRHGSTPRFAF